MVGLKLYHVVLIYHLVMLFIFSMVGLKLIKVSNIHLDIICFHFQHGWIETQEVRY